ncbi:primosomal protein [Microbacterium sp. ARD31]|uniref:primosomal protein n=1 Tax=Microbacterium sp. ARD31 TaxID=2962576 RepID=UPI00288278DF|nr:primosomal protein [Microbacterium sp. ARD31]MDT0184038.1 primosomal protein [Microbacterium sp. ARD31]
MAEQNPRDEEGSSRASSDRRSGAPGKKPYAKRDGDRKPYAPRDGERKPYVKRDGDRKPYTPRESGDRKPYTPRESGDRKPYTPRESGDRKPYAPRDGERKPYVKRDGDRKPYTPREGAGARSARPTRAGAGRPDRAVRPGEARPDRPRHDDPPIPEEITPHDLNTGARNELKTLSKENADEVARHLAMASELIDEDPELAHRHALAASRRAGRIAIVRETLAITAYAIGDFALALRELRTYRRISGKDDQIALMVDSERGVGRPDRALEVGRSVSREDLPAPVRVELAIAMSGARLDLGDAERALLELDIPELDPDRAFEWSPALFAARAAVLEELGRTDEADRWHQRAVIAADALDAASGLGDLETITIDEIDEIDEIDDVDDVDDEPMTDPASTAPVDEQSPDVSDEEDTEQDDATRDEA